jgi:hypothetical protein
MLSLLPTYFLLAYYRPPRPHGVQPSPPCLALRRFAYELQLTYILCLLVDRGGSKLGGGVCLIGAKQQAAAASS